jgi:hypothetical protein
MLITTFVLKTYYKQIEKNYSFFLEIKTNIFLCTLDKRVNAYFKIIYHIYQNDERSII